MKIVLGADHRGYTQKEYIKTIEFSIPITWIDVGACDAERSDYPVFAMHACEQIVGGNADCGVLLCGSGNGMAITANRYAGIYAGLVWNEEVARLAREHDQVNVLVIPSDYVDNTLVVRMINAWLTAHFFGDRYKERITMIDLLGGVIR